jgi:hypothetical protein
MRKTKEPRKESSEMTDQIYNKLDLATEQLDVALWFFLKRKRLASALLLAGAADEILSQAVSHRGEQNSLDRRYEVLELLYSILDGRPLSREDFIRDENRALTAVTHMESASDWSVTLDLEDAAYSMIVRACHNYDLLGLRRTANMREFEDWFYEHVIGLADPLPEYEA